MNKLRTLIIGSALVGAFVLGAVFGHLKPWQRKADERIESFVAAYAARAAIPRVLARCMAAGVSVPVLPTDPYDEKGDRQSFVMLCMRGEGYEYDTLAKSYHGEACDIMGNHHDYENQNCYRLASR